jgi:hypothetical protein
MRFCVRDTDGQGDRDVEAPIQSIKTEENSASADGGPRSRVCARETLRSDPHQR